MKRASQIIPVKTLHLNLLDYLNWKQEAGEPARVRIHTRPPKTEALSEADIDLCRLKEKLRNIYYVQTGQEAGNRSVWELLNKPAI